MGSLCQSKPAVSNSSSTQTYTPAGVQGMQDTYNKVAAAASTPYNPYQGQLVAGLDQTTQSGIGGINANANAAQPYYAQAQNYATAGASAITPEEIASYNNPYQQQVIDATRANFNETNQQQQSAQRGNAALKGALGGDRAGVAGAELTRQQNLAQNPVIAGMYQQGYDKSLAAAQADRAAKAQGAAQFGALGNAAQTSALQGGQAQIGAGQVAQQTEQNKLGANYQQYLNAQAFPYQQAQFQAQYGLPALQAQGGTQTGQSQTTQQQAQASPFSQALGVGLTAAGLFTGNPFMAMSGAGSMFGSGGSGWVNGSAPQGTGANLGGYGGSYNADGGRVNKSDGGSVSLGGAASNPYFANGGFLDTVRSIRSALREHYAEGGVVGRRNFGSGGAANPMLPQALEALSSNESGSAQGDYGAIGPMTKYGRALGRWQVMPNNIPEWSRAAIGREVTPDEFLKSPELQDQIVKHRFGQYLDKYGPSGAARAWIAGEGGMNNPNLRDGYGNRRGTSVGEYESKFNRAMGIPSQDREQLAAMAGGEDRPQSASQMLLEKYAPESQGQQDMNAARKRAIALGMSMAMGTGGGGSGFADGGAINKGFGGGAGNPLTPIEDGGMSSIERKADFGSRFQPFAPITGGASFNPANAGIPGIPRVQQGFEDLDRGQKPSWQDPPGLPATGSPYQMEDDTPPPPSNDAGEGRVETADGEGPHTDITSRDRTDRQDPYSVYEGNKPQGTSADDIRYGLMAAGLGILGGKSSNALTNIGEGGLKGLMAYQGSKKQRESAELVARRLMQQSEQFNQGLDLKEREFRRKEDADQRKEDMFDRRLRFQESAADRRLAIQEASEKRRLDAIARKEGLEAEKQRPLSPAEKEEVKRDSKRIEELRKSGDAGREALAEIDVMEKSLPGMWTGPFMGATIGKLDSDNQAFEASKARITPLLGSKMKGSFSDKDAAMIQSAISSNWSGRDSVQTNLSTLRAASERAKLRSQFFEDYLETNQKLKGADEAWDRFAKENQMFVDDKKAPGGRRLDPNRNDDYTPYLGGVRVGQKGTFQDAVQKLKADPSLAKAFDEQFGPGSAANELGTK